MTGVTTPAPARRDAEATKTTILRAARYLLARRPQADITLKEIAERAGVSSPLVLKYFGNKHAVFTAVMSFETDADALLDAPLDELGAHMIRHILLGQREQGADPLLRIAFAPLHGEDGETLRINFRTQVIDHLTTRLTGEDRALRAELAIATLIGLGVMHGIARGPAIRTTAVEEAVRCYAPGVQALLTPGP
ncbi:TetR family transcriptional regulator [Streptomyces boninensis]|uniref:TetR/AcrR family transcriptional regulator n=1 Tax=Streptomyces boninensis TaxID=2039455 RepID=UPI003B2110B1